MEKFSFEQDIKQTCWYRSYFEVTADSLEEAKKIAIENLKDKFVVEYCDENEDCPKIEFLVGEMIFDSGELMSVEQNGGQSTIEITYNMETICENGK